jgi:hypothetical protein
MSLEKRDYLYRIRVLFDRDGNLSLVETVNKCAIVDDGAVISESDSKVQSVSVGTLGPAVAALLAEIDRAKAEDEAARQAELARLAAEEAARVEAERIAAEAKAAEDAAQA